MKPVALLLLLLIAGLFPSRSRAESEGQTWAQFLSQGKLTEDLRFWGELQPRFSLDRGNFTTVMVRPGLGWQATPDLSLWLGYAWTPLLNPTWRNEHRIWSQAIYTLNLEPVVLTQRLRLESRFLENISGAGFRLRYQARLAVPVAMENALQFVTYDEVFLGLNRPAASIASGFDQNRFFVGGNYRFTPQLAFDLGYMWNLVRNATLSTNRSNHVVMLSIYYSFDLTEQTLP